MFRGMISVEYASADMERQLGSMMDGVLFFLGPEVFELQRGLSSVGAGNLRG